MIVIIKMSYIVLIIKLPIWLDRPEYDEKLHSVGTSAITIRQTLDNYEDTLIILSFPVKLYKSLDISEGVRE